MELNSDGGRIVVAFSMQMSGFRRRDGGRESNGPNDQKLDGGDQKRDRWQVASPGDQHRDRPGTNLGDEKQNCETRSKAWKARSRLETRHERGPIARLVDHK